MIFALLLTTAALALGVQVQELGLAESFLIAALLWFAVEFLVLSPARYWRDSRKAALPVSVTFAAGSVAEGGTVIVYNVPPGQIGMGFDHRPPLVDEPDDDPDDTATEPGARTDTY